MKKVFEALRFAFLCPPEKPPSSGRKVAIVGGGPAGLIVAGYLACRGHEVTIFDKLPEAGGLMYFVIPEIRVSSKRVLAGIEELRKIFGVEIVTGTKVVGGEVPRDEEDHLVKKVLDFEEIVRDFDAVVIATGTWRTKRLNVPGEDAEGVYTALDLLFRIKASRLGYLDIRPPELYGRRIAIAGGGLMALDVAMEAVYEGASEVTIFYEATLSEAPAGEYAIRSLSAKGVRFVERSKIVGILTENGVAKGIEVARCQPPSYEPVPGTSFVVDVDIVVNAIDVEPTPPFPSGYMGMKLDDRGRIVVDEYHRALPPKIFATGDVVLGPSKLGLAIRDALETARIVDRFLARGM